MGKDKLAGQKQMVQINVDKIPNELKVLKQWVNYKLIWNEKRMKYDKVPYQVNGRRASSTDPSTWRSFEAVLNAALSGKFDGIGFVFTEKDHYCGVDLDRCGPNIE